MTTIVLTGAGAHSDPWHALPATSSALAGLLDARVVPTDDDLGGIATPADVIVVNASGDPEGERADSTPVVDVLLDHVAAGGGVVAVHSSTLAFPDDPRWAALMGGRWVPGVSGHPPIGQALVQGVSAGAGDAAAAGRLAGDLVIADFVAHDERYTALETAPDIEVVAFHTEDSVTHPLAWLNPPHPGLPGRVAYSALGHGVESYDSPNADFTRSLVEWARRR